MRVTLHSVVPLAQYKLQKGEEEKADKNINKNKKKKDIKKIRIRPVFVIIIVF